MRQNRAITTFFLLAALSGLAACNGLTQPFEGAERNDAIIDTITVNPSVMIAPIQGAPAPLNQILAERLAAATQARDVAAVTRGAGKAASLMLGRVTALPNSDGGTELAFEWQLNNAEGLPIGDLKTLVTAFPLTADDPWLLYANTDLTPVIADATEFLVTQLYRPSAQAALPSKAPGAPPPVFQEGSPYYLHIQPVQGAPGDGRISLTRAMVSLLSQEDLPIALLIQDAPTPATFIIDAQVKIADLDAYTQQIDLNWRLKSPTGEVLGNVQQSNAIQSGSLDGEWGDTAFLAAAAAADGLLSMLLQFDPLTMETETENTPME